MTEPAAPPTSEPVTEPAGSPAFGSDPVTVVFEQLDALRDRMIDSLVQAVRIPSVSPDYPGVRRADHLGREGEVAELLAGLYEEAGARTDLVATQPGRANAVGVVPGAATARGRSLIFNGHVDVVPPGDPAGWRHPPFSAHVADGVMYGRGTADQKAGLVAQAFAALALRRAGVVLAGDLCLQAVVGEETGDHAAGIQAVLDRGYRADLAIVSEPTADVAGSAAVQVTAPGITRFTVTVRGLRAHGCLRGETVHPTNLGSAAGVSAVDKGFLIYSALRQLEQEWAESKRHPLFRNGHFALSPAVVRAQADDTPVPAILPNWMSIDYSVIYHPDERVEQVRAEIERHIRRAAQLDPWLRRNPPEVVWAAFHWPPLRTEPDHPGVQSLAGGYHRATGGAAGATTVGPLDPEGAPAGGLRITAGRGVSDATYLSRAGVPAMVFGPGALDAAHAHNESVRLDEVFRAARTYAATAIAWCGVARSADHGGDTGTQAV